MRDDERNEAVAAHLRALDAEIARLRRLEEALDRRIEQGGSAPGQPPEEPPAPARED